MADRFPNDSRPHAADTSSTRCVKLEADTNATFEQKSWMSKSLAKNLLSYYDIHAGFLLDLVGRPNYWSALSQVKSDPRHHKDVFGELGHTSRSRCTI